MEQHRLADAAVLIGGNLAAPPHAGPIYIDQRRGVGILMDSTGQQGATDFIRTGVEHDVTQQVLLC